MRAALPWLLLASRVAVGLGRAAAVETEEARLQDRAAELIVRFEAWARSEQWHQLRRLAEEPANSSAVLPAPEIVIDAKTGDEELEEEEFSASDVASSWTLIGSLTFTMIIFYFVNYPDDDIKRYTWSIINTTLSIFTAVMLFTGFDEAVMELILDPTLGAFPTGWRSVARAACGFLIFLLWFGVAHLVVSFFAGVLVSGEEESEKLTKQWVVADAMRGDHGMVVPVEHLHREGHSKGLATVDGVEVFVSSRAVVFEGYERRTKCWALLFSHMAGFAMISAGGDLQHVSPFVDSAAFSWLAVVLSALFLLLLFSLTAAFFSRGDKSESEAQKLYREEGLDAEDDIFCLAVSFLAVQSVRFTISGRLPSKLGLYGEELEYVKAEQMVGLYFCAVILLTVMVAGTMLMHGGRVKDLTVGTLSMGFAWCVLFATRSAFSAWPLLQRHNLTPDSIEGRVLLAMVLSLFTCAIIVVLDKIEDASRKEGDRSILKLLKNIITGLSILIGFTWEHTFDGCVEAISSLWTDKLLGKITLTLAIVIIVVPAWRRYILARVVELHKADRERKAAMEKVKDGYAAPTSEESSEEESSARLIC